MSQPVAERAARLEERMDRADEILEKLEAFQGTVLEFIARYDERENKRERVRSLIRALTIGALSSAIGWFGKKLLGDWLSH